MDDAYKSGLFNVVTKLCAKYHDPQLMQFSRHPVLHGYRYGCNAKVNMKKNHKKTLGQNGV